MSLPLCLSAQVLFLASDAAAAQGAGVSSAEATIYGAMIAALVAAIGWLVTHSLQQRREEKKRKLEAQLIHTERQISELYAPLAASLYQGQRAFEDLLIDFGRDTVFPKEGQLTEDELRTWLFWAEAEFLPRNEKIMRLLEEKAHLVEGDAFPESYVEFFRHSSSWAIRHRRWKEEGVRYSWRSRINWPKEFEREVLSTFAQLKRRHSQLIGMLAT